MKKSFVNYIFYSVTLFLVSFTSVFALNVDNSKDLITATDTSSGFFYVNNSQDYNTASRFKDTGGIEETINKKAMTSVKNGTYYVWHYSTSGIRSNPVKVHVSNSCDNELKTKQTGTFTMERCYVKTSSAITEDVPLGNNVNFCANGYKVTAGNIIGDTCTNLSLNGLSKRYCKRVFQFTCTQTATTPETPTPTPDPTPEPTVPAATLSALSINAGTLSPAFNSGTYKYKATVESSVSSIKISATASSGNTLVKGAGSRTVNLNYGSNTIKVKVQNSAGKVTTYKITVTRNDDRSTVNTLSNITISAGTLSPAFSSDKTSYSVEVGHEVSSISIDATLTDSKSKFASGFGPRSVPLSEGINQIYIKVTNEKDVTKVYTITVNRGSVPSGCTLQEGELALLKGIEIESSETNPIKIEDFDPLKFDYVGITVPYDVKNLTILPLVQDEGDTYVIDGANDLEVYKDQEITITVTSKACPSYSSIYKLIVTRLPQVEAGTTADLKSLTIKNHSEFKFQKNVLDYNLTLKKGEKKLGISYKPEEKTTKCNVHDNDNLSYGDVVTIECNTPDDIDKVTYKITIDGVEKGTNPVIIVLFVIIIIIILVLLIMRMLGYKIYFNMEALKAAFRGMGEKARNTFDK